MLAQLLLTLPVVWLGRHFYADGIRALLRGAPAMRLVVGLATGLLFLSVVSAVKALCPPAFLNRAQGLQGAAFSLGTMPSATALRSTSSRCPAVRSSEACLSSQQKAQR